MHVVTKRKHISTHSGRREVSAMTALRWLVCLPQLAVRWFLWIHQATGGSSHVILLESCTQKSRFYLSVFIRMVQLFVGALLSET